MIANYSNYHYFFKSFINRNLHLQSLFQLNYLFIVIIIMNIIVISAVAIFMKYLFKIQFLFNQL